MTKRNNLPDYDGETAFKGALRFFDSEDDSWKNIWGKYYGSLMPNIEIFASDAFGTIFGLINNIEVAIFWSEIGELEYLGVGVDEFYEMIIHDPDGTINLNLYLSAVEKYGKPSLEEHFAFKIETALGGELTTENIVIMNANEHFIAMGKIATQIKDIPDGQRIVDISLEH